MDVPVFAELPSVILAIFMPVVVSTKFVRTSESQFEAKTHILKTGGPKIGF
jgi:hypothetical protein